MKNIEHINPDTLSKNPAFSQIVATHGSGTTIYIGGQNSVNKNLEIVGKNDIALQTKQALTNIENALNACNCTFNNIVKMNIYIVQGNSVQLAFQASQEFFKGVSEPPAITVIFVAALANPDFLIEIDAVAFIPD